MLALRLVRLIETHSEELSESLVEKLRTSQRTTSYRALPPNDLKALTIDVYQHLGDWLLSKTESDIELRYTSVGVDRASRGIPFSEFLWAVIITKENLWRYLQSHVFAERAFELFGELEFLQALEQFFDRATYYAMVGYEKVLRAEGRAA